MVILCGLGLLAPKPHALMYIVLVTHHQMLGTDCEPLGSTNPREPRFSSYKSINKHLG